MDDKNSKKKQQPQQHNYSEEKKKKRKGETKNILANKTKHTNTNKLITYFSFLVNSAT